MRNKRTRLWSILLATVALLSLLSVTALADEGAKTVNVESISDLQKALTQANNGDTIKLAAGTYNVGQLRVEKAVNIQGSGKDTVIVGAIGYWYAGNEANITVSDLTIVSPENNTSIQQAIWWSYDGNHLLTDSDLTVSNCTIKNFLFGIGVNSGAQGCTLTVDNLTLDNVWCGANVSEGAGNMIKEFSVMPGSSVVYEVQVFDLSGKNYNNYYDSFTSCEADEDRTIPTAAGENITVPNISAGNWPAVAKIGTTYYGNLQNAVNAASGSDIIELVDDVTLTNSVNISSGKTVTIDGGHHTISYPVYSPKVAFTGADTYNREGIQANTTLNVSNVTFKNTSTGDPAGYAVIVGFDSCNTSVNLKDCTFENLRYAVYANPFTNVGCVEEAPDITITDSTFKNTTFGYAVDEVTEGALVGVVNPTFTGNSENVIESESWANVTLKQDGIEVAYASLEAALNDADDGDTITLGVGTFTVNNAIVLNKQLTLQGSGEKTVINGTYKQDYGNGLFTFTGGSEGSVLKNLTIQYTGAGAQQAAVYFDYGFTGGSADQVTKIQNVHFIGDDSVIAVSSTYTTGGFVEISGCTIENFKYGMYFNAIHDLTISGNTIDGTKYNAINIAGDGEIGCSNIIIEGNVLKNISKANYSEPAYSSGIRIGLNSENIAVENNDIAMLNGKEGIYIDPTPTGEAATRYVVTVMDGQELVGQYIVDANTELELPSKPSKSGYTFLGWWSNVTKETYKAGASVKITADTTFYAQWLSNWGVIGGIAGAVPADTFFTDVSGSAWYYDAVKFVYDYDLMDGVGNNKFNPDGTLTRAMIAQVLYNLEGQTGSYPTAFTDVAKSAWYADAVNWAAASGIVEGKGNNKFDPDAAITRQELATIFYRYSELKGYDVSKADSLSGYKDAAQVASWAKDAMGWAVENYVVNGVGNSMLNPTGTATRAQVAQILMNYCNNVL